jgi:hypothetical protein
VPRTEPKDGLDLSKKSNQKLLVRLKDHFERKYTVCAVTKDFAEWKEYGLYKRLIKHVCRDFKQEIVLLDFPIENKEKIYIREHANLSPKRFFELCGSDLFRFFDGESAETLSKEECRLFNSQLRKYFASTVPLKDYDCSFQLPEIWYPHKVSADDIVVEEVLV